MISTVAVYQQQNNNKSQTYFYVTYTQYGITVSHNLSLTTEGDKAIMTFPLSHRLLNETIQTEENSTALKIQT